MAGIVVVGSINLDLILPCARIPRPGETLHAHARELAPGGKGANQAVAAARLGGDVAMVGAVGDDTFAEPALALLSDAGVDLTHVRRVQGATGLAVVYVDDAGENSILIEGGANRSVDADAVRAAAAVVEAADVVVLQGEIPRSGIEAAAELTRGRLLVNLAPVIDVSPDVLRRADPLVVNEHEGSLALRMLGQQADGDDAVVAALLEAGVPAVVMTRGAKGALVGRPDQTTEVGSPRVEVVDTTGAGDAFVGALATRLVAGDDLVDAATFAARVGAFACTGRGAQPSYPRSGDTLPS
ncbi:MAG: ribokinase [Propionibacteriaceae bacterium]|nr:ribokinase [Propionibacteriaceae bacterium]